MAVCLVLLVLESIDQHVVLPEVLDGFPCRIGLRVPLPLDLILRLATTPETFLKDPLHNVLSLWLDRGLAHLL
jgi:hypothetical protein